MLIEMMDGLLNILDNYPDYRSYLLDSQSVPVEDYLEARPENRDRVIKHVSAGRLMIGPWYTDPEGFSVNGESMVRNLTYGHRVSKGFGKVMKVGHTPFGYGQNSQMPQIYQGFGIDTMLFYHGVSHDEVENEWIFEGADGSRVLGSQMSSYARYNAYHALYRPALYNDKIDDRSYTWDRGGLPFHLCRKDPAMRQHLLLDVQKGWNEELLIEELKILKDTEVGVSTTRHLAFMMGHDSSVADELELKIMEVAKRIFPDIEVRHSTMEEMMDAIKSEVEWDKLTVLKGERRTPKLMPVTLHMFSDVLSSRSRMKTLNTKAEYLLQRRAEPLSVLAAQLGEEYPATLLDLAWKGLLRCHAHDSIAGSGVDDIEQDMMYRLRQVVNLSDGLVRTALGNIQKRIDNNDATKDDVLFTVFNATPQARTETVSAIVDIPNMARSGEFALCDVDGNPVPTQLLTRKPHTAIVNHAGDAPANMPTEQFQIHFEAKDVPAMGYTSFKLDRKQRFARGGLLTATNTLENDFLKVKVQTDGTLSITHKETGVTYDDLNYYLDNGEAGHAWMHHNPGVDRVVDSRAFSTSIAMEEDGALLSRFRIDCHMEVPARLEENGGDPWQRLDGVGSVSSRSEQTLPMTITTWVTLRKHAKHIEITTRFNNQAKHHRLRAIFPTRIPGNTCHAESQFDVVERETVFSPDNPWCGAKSVTFPMQRFVDVSDGKAGMAIINKGLREYEVMQDDDRAIAMTLMRAYEVSLCPVSKCWEQLPEMELAQCVGQHEFTYRIYPHAGDYVQGEVFGEADALTVPLETAQAGPHGGDLPKKKSFFEIQPANLALSAYKQSEDKSGWVMRLFNPTSDMLNGVLTFAQAPKTAELVTLEECNPEALTISGSSIQLNVAPKKIVNVKVTF